MKTLLTVIAILGLLATSAAASHCPLLIKQLNDAVAAAMSPNDAKVKAARALIDEARKLHAEGRHAESIAKADEAAKALGVTLKKP